MENEVCFNALQKFYSALRNLNSFSVNNDAIDNISSLDCFFSEFRNITFVLQKDFSDNGIKDIYEKLRSKYLENDEMRWFVKQRNNTTKQSPIKLKKNIIFDIYMPNNRITLESEKLKLNIEESFNITKDFIKSFLLEKLGIRDVYFSTHIIFKENNENIDILPKIISGIETMLKFFTEIYNTTELEKYVNMELFNKVISLYESIIINNSTFIHDYYTENNEIKSVNNDVQLYFKEENLFKRIDTNRVPLNKQLFGDENDLEKIFERFEIMHIVIYNESDGNIMPVFMIIYEDFSSKLIPIYATSKTAIYREIYNIVDNVNFKDVIAIFYCSEMYVYNIEKFNTINNLDYSERINNKDENVLSFFHINNKGKTKNININTRNINDISYVMQELHKENEFTDNYEMFFLQPIIEKIKKANKKSDKSDF